MKNKIKQFTNGEIRNNTTISYLSHLNDIVDGVNRANNISITGLRINHKKSPLGDSFTIPPVGKPSSSLFWGNITQTLTYPDPTKPTNNPLYLGHSFYKLKLSSENITVWQIGLEVNFGDQVVHPDANGIIYTSKQEITYNASTPNEPPDDGFWEESNTIKVKFAIGHTDVTPFHETAAPKGKTPEELLIQADLRNYIPWYKLGEIVPLLKKEDNYFILQTLSFVGTGEQRSLSYNNNDGHNRVMAVFQ